MSNAKDILIKIVSFFAICAYVLGTVGGIGCAIHDGAFAIAAAVLVMAVMAFPTFKSFVKRLIE